MDIKFSNIVSKGQKAEIGAEIANDQQKPDSLCIFETAVKMLLTSHDKANNR
jgi:hypothetical protein